MMRLPLPEFAFKEGNGLMRHIAPFAFLAMGILVTISCRSYVFDPPKNLGPPINGEHFNNAPAVTSDGLELYFTSGRSGGKDIWVSRRESKIYLRRRAIFVADFRCPQVPQLSSVI